MDKGEVYRARGLVAGEGEIPLGGDGSHQTVEEMARISREPARVIPAFSHLGCWVVVIGDVVVTRVLGKEEADAFLVRVEAWRAAVWAQEAGRVVGSTTLSDGTIIGFGGY